MSNLQEVSGSCLCGSVSFKAAQAKNNIGTCHCNMCRNWSGGPFFALDGGTDVSIEGEENLTIYDSSEWAQRGFCSKCGSNLFYKLKQTGLYIFALGAVKSEHDFVFDHQIFIDEKPDYYCFSNETHNMTGAEVFAQFGAE